MSVVASCDRMEDDLFPDGQVRLQASLTPVLSTVYTKGIGEIKSDYNGSLPIGIARSDGENSGFETVNTVYGAVMGKYVPEKMGLRDIEFNEFQAFPTGGQTVNYIGWYPHSSGYCSNGKVTIPVDGSTDILYSDVASGNRLGGFNTMTFRHALVKYSVMVYGTEEGAGSVASTWGNIKTVEFAGMPKNCILTLPAASKTDGQPAVPSISSSGSEGRVFTKEAQIPTSFSKALNMGYILAPAPTDNILNISITTEKRAISNLNLSVSSTFQPGKHYQIYLRFSPEGVVNAEVKVADWQESNSITSDNAETVFYDLSETHTANSYIVSAPNSYCFNATVRGNGYTGIAGIPGAAGDLYLVGDPVSAEIVWTDLVGGLEDDLDQYFTLSPTVVDGRVFFSVKPGNSGAVAKEGNVVIGVKDAAGRMLWTWHIWITDRPTEQGYKNGFAVQDRDLGATAYNAETEPAGINGFYYQWGRPTPLPLGKTVYKPEYNQNGEWTSNVPVVFQSSDGNKAVIDRVAEPTTFFNQRATASDGTLTKSLWGWRNEADEYAKTIYDPCPPGYRVPSIKLWRDLVILDENHDGSHDAKIITNNGKNIATAFKVDVNNAQIYYPMTGYYTAWNTQVGNNVGAYMWAATFYVGALNDASDDQPYALDFVIDNGELKAMRTDKEFSNYAMPVRCISRMSKAHVVDLSDYQTANSYIVSKKGYYKFKATVRGNGIGQLVAPGSTSTIVLTEQLQTVDMKNQLVKVEPLWWHSYDSATAPDGNNFTLLNEGKPDADGYVSFKVDTWRKGNMILAGRDAKGEIIWSWHIWFTDEPAMMKSNSFVVMDRNLGATFAPTATTAPANNGLLNETYGFYYQWGRKDPFVIPGTSVYRYNNGTWQSNATLFTSISGSTEKTVGNSVAKPMTYHLTSSSNTTIYNDNGLMSGTFSVASNNTAEDQCFSNMIHPEDRQSLWGYSAATGYGVTTTKTMYDPCPPGYMVAHYLVWTNTERNSNSGYLYYSNLDGGFKSHGSSGTQDGLFLTNWSTLFDPAWFPYSGYINGSTGSLSEQRTMGMFHTSTPAGNGARSLMYNSTYSGQGVDGGYRGLPSSYGYPVRCQKE